MSIQSLGVGSGLDLEGLVTQLLEAERKPKTDRIDKREEEVEAENSVDLLKKGHFQRTPDGSSVVFIDDIKNMLYGIEKSKKISIHFLNLSNLLRNKNMYS